MKQRSREGADIPWPGVAGWIADGRRIVDGVVIRKAQQGANALLLKRTHRDVLRGKPQAVRRDETRRPWNPAGTPWSTPATSRIPATLGCLGALTIL